MGRSQGGKLRQNADCDIEACELEGVTCCHGQGVCVPVEHGIIFVLFFTMLGEEGLRDVGWDEVGTLIYFLLLA